MGRIKKTLFVFIVILILSGLMAFSAIIFIQNKIRERRFSDLLEQVDQTLSSHDYSRSRSLLKSTLTQASTKKEYLRVIKRAFLLSERMDNISIFKEFALHAALEKARDEELVFIASYACLKTGDSSRALELLEKPAATGRLLSLKVEALIKKGETENLETYYTPSEPFRFLRLLSTDDPGFYEDSAGILKDRRLFLDASLLFAHKKNIREAFRIVSSYEGDPIFLSPGVFIAYDAGEYGKAEQFINRLLKENTANHALLYCLYGDIKIHSGEYDKAVSFFEKAIALDPLVSETAYLNISYVYQEKGDIQNALEWLKKGFKVFQQNRNIVLEASRLFTNLKDQETASSIIRTYKETNPGDFMIDFMLFYLDQGKMHPSRYRTGLWDLYNANPGNEFLCRFLVLYLLGIEDVKGAGSALTLFDIQRGIGENKQEYLSWVLHYKGICEAMAGAYRRSLDFFASSLAIDENPYVLFHKALVLIELKNLKAARDDLFAITEMNSISVKENISFLSQVTASLGRIFILLGEYGKAWDQLTLAHEIDPKNYQVLAMMKELEELQQ